MLSEVTPELHQLNRAKLIRDCGGEPGDYKWHLARPKRLKRERENFNHALFAFPFFSRRQDRELLGAISLGLLECPCRV